MIPISDNIFFFSHKRPIIVYGLIGLNLVIFLWEIKLELSNELTNVIYNWGIIPKQISAAFIELLTGNFAAIIIIFISLASLIVATFLHSSFSQILGNILFLWVFGQTIEKIIGYRGFILFYLVSSIITSIIQILVDPNLAVPLIGSNGAIAAILGAYITKFPQTKIYSVLPLIVIFIPVEIPAFFYLFWWFAQQLFYGIGSLNITGGVNPPSLAYWMHGVGLIIGAAFMRIRK
ncbi:MAG: rhomboid family intramembrane serine protease [Calothrix sp. MO_192.B10]|nr:rhomboid family intramembrane serine protease [Calothrix sp. MO_192.B10]